MCTCKMVGIAGTSLLGFSGMVFSKKKKKHSICIISLLILVLLHEQKSLYDTFLSCIYYPDSFFSLSESALACIDAVYRWELVVSDIPISLLYSFWLYFPVYD